MSALAAEPVKPRFRGVLHEYAFFVSLGCGVGLVLQHLARRCRVYRGTDISASAIAGLSGWLKTQPGLQHVELARREAAELGDLEPHAEGLPLDTQLGARLDLERAVARLPLRYREVFVLHDVYEHTHAEIALMLGIDEGTSKSNLSRGRAKLREWMGEPS